MQVAIPTVERHRRLIVSAVVQKKATQRPPYLFIELGLTNDVVQCRTWAHDLGQLRGI